MGEEWLSLELKMSNLEQKGLVDKSGQKNTLCIS